SAVERNTRAGKLRRNQPRNCGLALHKLCRSEAGAMDHYDFAGEKTAHEVACAISHGTKESKGGTRVNEPDGVIPCIGQVEVARRIGRQAPRSIQLRVRGRTAVAGIAARPIASYQGDRSIGRNLAYAILRRIAEVDSPCEI